MKGEKEKESRREGKEKRKRVGIPVEQPFALSLWLYERALLLLVTRVWIEVELQGNTQRKGAPVAPVSARTHDCALVHARVPALVVRKEAHAA